MYSIYIHVPFCKKKCNYCDFYSIENINLFKSYIEALLLEIDLRIIDSRIIRPKVSSVFFGGGTPSLLFPEQLERIVDKINMVFDVKDDAEWTIEANPGTYDYNLIRQYRNIGINRISIGIQSFNNDELKFLQRIHNAEEAEKSIYIAKEAGFDNINIDIIFSIPGKSIDIINDTINKTLELEPTHISAYSLIYEPGTPLYEAYIKGEVKKNDDDIDAIIYRNVINKITGAGYTQYEVSNFAKPNKKCRHNLHYWLSGEYFAFGPSAHGFLNNKRYANVKSLDIYYRYVISGRLPISNSEELSINDSLNERVMLELRAEGIRIDEFNKDFNIDLLKECSDLIYEWKENNYVQIINNKMMLTANGYMISDSLTTRLIKNIESPKK